MNQQNALLVALNALQAIDDKHPYPIAKHAIVQISKALAQSDNQEPVAWDGDCVLGHCGSPDGCDRSGCCRAAPPSKPKEWVSLTDEEMKQTCYEAWSFDPYVIAQAIQEKLRSKNEH